MSLESRPVSLSRVTMTELVLPNHTNSLGGAFGGTIMSWIDIAAAIAARRHCRKIAVTASVDDLHFIAPIYEGWIVNLKASVNFTAKTSMEVGVRVDAEDPETNKIYHTVSAYLTFVALGDNRKPTEIPQVLAEDEEDQRRFEAGKLRRELRLERRKIFMKKK